MKKVKLAAMACLLAISAYAQRGGPPPGGPGFGGPLPGGFRPGKVVTGAPYSATVTNSTTETLMDGNTIQRTTTAQVARDSEGRSYEQQTLDRGPLGQNTPTTIIFIEDPVAGYAYVLNTSNKTYTQRKLPAPRSGTPPANPNPPSNAGRSSGPMANTVESDLTPQNINGVMAQGKSTTHTIPAGAMGNAKPIVSTSETWYSPDLQIPVLSKHVDPRTGSSIYAVTDINRSEPNASLFQVPSDYTLQSGPQGRGRGPGGPRGNGPPPPPPAQ